MTQDSVTIQLPNDLTEDERRELHRLLDALMWGAANGLVDLNWQPDRALDLLEERGALAAYDEAQR